MADKKISALTASTTPLAGTEVLPIVQGGSTVKVSVANLTAGRAVNALSATTTSGLRNTSAGSDTEDIAQGLFLTDAATKNAIVQLSASGGVSTFIFEAGGAGWRRVSGLLTNGNNVVDVGNLVIGTAGKGIVDSTSAVALNFSSTAATLNSPLAQTGTINTLTNDFSARSASMALNDTLTISNLTTGVIEISEMAFFSNIAVIAVSGAATAIVYRSDLATTITAGNPGTLNVYRSGANVIIENKNAATLQVRTNIRKLG